MDANVMDANVIDGPICIHEGQHPVQRLGRDAAAVAVAMEQ
jgi:hypothetical protein